MIWNGAPIAFSIFGYPIRWYGLNYAFSFLYIEWFTKKLLKKEFPTHQYKKFFDNLFFGVFLCGIVGARIGEFLFYNFHSFLENPLEIFYIWNGGMSIHGGFIGGISFFLYCCYKNKIPFLKIANALVIPLSLSLGIGRITNFLNSEIIGISTDSKFGVVFSQIDTIARHPSQLYEAISMFVLFPILLIGYKKNKTIQQNTTLVFWIYYALSRFFIEFTKQSPLVFAGLKTGQILCIIMILFICLEYTIKPKKNCLFS